MRRHLLAAAIVAAACSAPTAPTQSSLVWQARLDQARQRWEVHGLAAYEYTYRHVCGECPPEWMHPRRVRIRDGEVVGVTDLTTGQDLDPAGWDWTIKARFERIQGYIDGGAARLVVDYHPVHGAPTSLSVDPVPGAIDDEHGYLITDLGEIPVPAATPPAIS